jgi:DNA-binding beta-propeller fold protein YncE
MRFMRFRWPGHACLGHTRRATLLLLAALPSASPARADDAAPEFTPNTNTAGARWTYGWASSETGAFTLYNAKGTDGFGLNYWRANPDNGSLVDFNGTGLTKSVGNNTTVPPGALSLFPGSAGQFAIVRWTAPVAGSYGVLARFIARSANSTAREIVVRQGATILFSRWMLPSVTGTLVSMATTAALAAGETIEFGVGPANDSNGSDLTSLDATVDLEPAAPGPAGPVLAFGLHRYAPARWPGAAFDEIAFDAANRRIAAQGKIRDLCGNVISNGPGGGAGLAWDSRTGTYWEVTPDRVVQRWNGAAVLDTAFTVPLTFTVPGTGLDTLESVRGIAVDSNYVYLVDAGPDPGQIPSNGWFKFTRTGVPVKSHKSSNFIATLDADPDALVDDIVYVPYASPVFRGRLLVALEHSGIQVLDTDGNYVDKFRWSQQSLTPSSAFQTYGKISAFAGIAIDPSTGNLYLENNDTGTAQVWALLPQQTAGFFAVGSNSSQPYLDFPNAGCNAPLWLGLPPAASLLFGAAYRPANHSVYSCDFTTGDLWRFDPRTGIGWRVGSTGLGSVWGMAYDPGRDVLYGGMEGSPSHRVMVIDPRTAEVAPLPGYIGYYTTDLAFDTADSSIYGVEEGPPTKLVRIDRDTGVGTVVAATTPLVGLDYDAASGRLIGASRSNRIYSVDPATGAADSIAFYPNGLNWEGLAVIPVPFNPLLVAVPREAPLRITPGLRAYPNPARGPTRVDFELPEAQALAVRVFDVAGRLVREVQSGPMAPGPHTVTWDGLDADARPVSSGIYFLRVESRAQSWIARVAEVR